MMTLIETLLWFSLGFLVLFYFSYYSLMVYEAKKPNNVRKQNIFPKVSLVIPAHNEERVILRKLENARKLDYPKEKLEVLVVDDGSTDKTSQIVQSFIDRNSSELKFQLIALPQRLGKASALNYALQHCSSKIILISDADTIFEKSALRKIVQNFADTSVGAATGRLSVINSNQYSTIRSYRSIFEILRRGESQMDSTPIFNGPIAAFRRKLFSKLESDTLADDTELSVKIREKGWKAVYDPEAIAYAHAPASLKSRIKQKSRRGRGVIQSFIRHRKILFNPQYGKYGFVIFPGEFFMHAISPILVIVILIASILMLAFKPTMHILIIGIALAAFVLLSLASKVTISNNKFVFAITVLTTFLFHQFVLILGLLPFGKRNSHKWEKIKD